MDPTFADKTITTWEAKGKLSSSSVLQRLDEQLDEYYGIASDEEPALNNTFDSFCNVEPDGVKRLTESSLQSLLSAKLNLTHSHSPLAAEISPLLFNVLAYLSTVPFPPAAPGGIPRGLTLAQLTRALVWFLPGRADKIMSAGKWGRARSRADHRRLIFQSLATAATTRDGSYDDDDDAAARRRRAESNSLEVTSTSSKKYAGPNHDDDEGGDEMFHDVLDVLFATQPRPNPGLAPVRRDRFGPVAREIFQKEEHIRLPGLYFLAIPREQLLALVRLALWYRSCGHSGEIGGELSRFTSEAEAFCDSLGGSSSSSTGSGGGEKGAVTWPQFDDGFRDAERYGMVLEPLFRLVSRALFDKS
ncbi:hypothetical protein F4778DRAFT_735309 [Xylariomycetidae sp. FL2044]|nr:hypothetical protein F4778DRAFT_735309 [Xylariomycetidae sp. FL2044]